MTDTLLELKDYSITFKTPDGEVKAVSNMNLTVKRGERIAIVGESGSGKSQTFLGIMGLLAKNGKTTGQALLEGKDVLALKPRELDQIRGKDMAMVFQDPMTALNPSLKISRQLTEQLEVHGGLTARAASAAALDMLKRVGIPDPTRRFHLYPHELSGGMRQRIVIAMALLTRPKLLIADEPTTALDVTIQAQILDLFNDLTAEMNTALVMITHDLGVVALASPTASPSCMLTASSRRLRSTNSSTIRPIPIPQHCMPRSRALTRMLTTSSSSPAVRQT